MRTDENEVRMRTDEDGCRRMRTDENHERINKDEYG